MRTGHDLGAERLESLADDLEERIRELQREPPGMPILRAHHLVN